MYQLSNYIHVCCILSNVDVLVFKPSKCPRSFRQSQRQNRDSTLNYCHLHPASKLEPQPSCFTNAWHDGRILERFDSIHSDSIHSIRFYVQDSNPVLRRFYARGTRWPPGPIYLCPSPLSAPNPKNSPFLSRGLLGVSPPLRRQITS